MERVRREANLKGIYFFVEHFEHREMEVTLCNEELWPGLKIDSGVHFSTLNNETKDVEFRP